MRKTIIAALLCFTLAVGVSACSDDDNSSATTTTTSKASSTTSNTDLSGNVNVSSSKFGDILVDKNGMTLYAYEKDTDNESTCNEVCADAWPPLTGELSAGDGVDESKLSEITRDDGSKQISYNGHPLYLWQGDSKAGDITGQDVEDFYVISPEGKIIEDED